MRNRDWNSSLWKTCLFFAYSQLWEYRTTRFFSYQVSLIINGAVARCFTRINMASSNALSVSLGTCSRSRTYITMKWLAVCSSMAFVNDPVQRQLLARVDCIDETEGDTRVFRLSNVLYVLHCQYQCWLFAREKSPSFSSSMSDENIAKESFVWVVKHEMTCNWSCRIGDRWWTKDKETIKIRPSIAHSHKDICRRARIGQNYPFMWSVVSARVLRCRRRTMASWMSSI